MSGLLWGTLELHTTSLLVPISPHLAFLGASLPSGGSFFFFF